MKNSFKTRLLEVLNECGNANALAKKAGISQTAVQRYKEGKSTPGMENLIAIADAAKVSIEWLATGRGVMRHGGTSNMDLNTFSASEISEAVKFMHHMEEKLDINLGQEKSALVLLALLRGAREADENGKEFSQENVVMLFKLAS